MRFLYSCVSVDKISTGILHRVVPYDIVLCGLSSISRNDTVRSVSGTQSLVLSDMRTMSQVHHTARLATALWYAAIVMHSLSICLTFDSSHDVCESLLVSGLKRAGYTKPFHHIPVVFLWNARIELDLDHIFSAKCFFFKFLILLL